MRKNHPSWLRLSAHLQAYWRDLIAASASMTIVAGISAVSVKYIQPLIDQILVQKNIEMLKLLAVVLPALFFIKSFFSYILNYLMPKIGQAVASDLRKSLADKYVRLDHSYHLKAKSADLIARATNDTAAVGNMVANTPLFVIRDGLTVIFLLGLIVFLNARFAVAVLVTIPLFGALFAFSTAKLKKITKKAQESVAVLYGTLSEALAGLSIIKIFLFEDAWGKRFGRQDSEYYRSMLKFQKYTALAPSINEFASGVVITCVLIWGGYDFI
ncbi:MAG: ABC transporter transmembrane domain-containing protein, partial [Elusimicrobiota bacterium]